MVNLVCFVADIAGCGTVAGKDKAFGASFVAAAQDGDMMTVAHGFDDMFDVGRLARSAYGQISDDYYGTVKFVLL